MNYRVISINNPQDDLVKLFYANHFCKAFPDLNERESLDNIILCMLQNNKGKYKPNNFHIFALMNDNTEIIGGAIFWYIADTSSGFIEYLFIDDHYRCLGLGSYLFNEIYNTLVLDAANSLNKLNNVYIEVENPNLVLNTQGALRRKSFWTRLGFSPVEINYIQPRLSANKVEVDYLQLYIRSCDKHIKSDDFINYIKQMHKLVYPEANYTITSQLISQVIDQNFIDIGVDYE